MTIDLNVLGGGGLNTPNGKSVTLTAMYVPKKM